MSGDTGGIVLLFLGLMLLVMFFSGRLEWLFNLGNQVGAARAATAVTTGPSRPTTSGR